MNQKDIGEIPEIMEDSNTVLCIGIGRKDDNVIINTFRDMEETTEKDMAMDLLNLRDQLHTHIEDIDRILSRIGALELVDEFEDIEVK